MRELWTEIRKEGPFGFLFNATIWGVLGYFLRGVVPEFVNVLFFGLAGFCIFACGCLVGRLLVACIVKIGHPRVWVLFSFILPKRIRERVYDPYHQELLEDYLLTRRKYRTKWARRWLAFCFAWRTAWLVVQCCHAVLADHAIRRLAKLIPEPVKRWWLS